MHPTHFSSGEIALDRFRTTAAEIRREPKVLQDLLDNLSGELALADESSLQQSRDYLRRLRAAIEAQEKLLDYYLTASSQNPTAKEGRSPRRYSEKEQEQIRHLRDVEGLPWREIALRFGSTADAISQSYYNWRRRKSA